jgi:glycosyltransferase involved in cell wall biosynthesis
VESIEQPEPRNPDRAGPSARVTLSACGVLGELGMGQGALKLALAFLGAGTQLHMICAGGDRRLAADAHVDVIDTPKLGAILARTPVRLWPGLVLALANNYFDVRARGLVRPSALFYGYTDQALWSMRRAQRQGAVTVLHAANTHIDNLVAQLRHEAQLHGVLQNWIGRWMVWKIHREYKEASFIRAQSTLVRDSLIQHGVPREKILFIPPAVDLQRFRPRARRDNTFRVAFVGSFDLRKGIQYLLRAWDEAALPNSELVLHGGSGSQYIDNLLVPYRNRPNVVFRSGDPAPTYAEASVCVVPSIEDGFAYVVLEALASGCPVIVSDQVGGKDAIRHGENGFIIPSRDVNALTARLRELHADPARRNEMASAARTAAEAYSFDAERDALIKSLPLHGRGEATGALALCPSPAGEEPNHAG